MAFINTWFLIICDCLAFHLNSSHFVISLIITELFHDLHQIFQGLDRIIILDMTRIL